MNSKQKEKKLQQRLFLNKVLKRNSAMDACDTGDNAAIWNTRLVFL